MALLARLGGRSSEWGLVFTGDALMLSVLSGTASEGRAPASGDILVSESGLTRRRDVQWR